MRVESIRIDRHGPLMGFSRTQLGDFTIIYGPNEYGKTLIIDALVKLLFRKEFNKIAKHLGNIQRVADPPEGQLVLDARGSQVTIAQGESIADHMDIDPQSFRNLFVVRDSDLSIVDDMKFYARLSERLAGLQTSEIDRIKRIIQQKGRLTNPSAKSDLSNAATADHAGRRVEAARQVIAELADKVTVFTNSDFDRLECRLVESKEQVARMRTELEMLKHAGRRERVEKCRKNLDELRHTTEKLRRLSRVSEDGLESWKQLDFERGTLRAELEHDERQRLTVETRLKDIDRDIGGLRIRVTGLETQHRHVEESLKPDVQKTLELQRASREHKTSIWGIGTVVSLGLLGISMVGAVVRSSMFFYMASVISMGLVAICVSGLVRMRRTESEVRNAFETLRQQAKRFGLNLEGFDDLSHIDNPVEDELHAERAKLRELELARQSHGNEQLTLNQKTRRNRERLQEVEEQIKELALQSGLPGVGAYRAALENQRELSGRLKTLCALLSDELGPAAPDVMIDTWDKALEQRMASGPDGEIDLQYDPARVRKLESEIGRLRTVVAETDDALTIGRRELRDVELKMAQSGILSDRQAQCRTTADLERLIEVLRDFIEDVELSADNAKAAIRLFEKIEVEEKSRLVELFGPGKPVSRLFKTMTDGLYDEVCFDAATNEIGVRTADHELLPADRLSGGALDQLYLAIRIAIAERLVTEPGFFILDDPFIKADFRRVQTQMTVLKRLVQMGWQILYFSAKKEVVDVLADDIRSGRIELIELDKRLNLVPSIARDRGPGARVTQSADLFPDD